jgi:hypothetical protein
MDSAVTTSLSAWKAEAVEAVEADQTQATSFFVRSERLGDSREPPDEYLVEVCEAEELLHVLLVLWGGPGGNSGDLHQVHLDMVVQDDD